MKTDPTTLSALLIRGGPPDLRRRLVQQMTDDYLRFDAAWRRVQRIRSYGYGLALVALGGTMAVLATRAAGQLAAWAFIGAVWVVGAALAAHPLPTAESVSKMVRGITRDGDHHDYDAQEPE